MAPIRNNKNGLSRDEEEYYGIKVDRKVSQSVNKSCVLIMFISVINMKVMRPHELCIMFFSRPENRWLRSRDGLASMKVCKNSELCSPTQTYVYL